MQLLFYNIISRWVHVWTFLTRRDQIVAYVHHSQSDWCWRNNMSFIALTANYWQGHIRLVCHIVRDKSWMKCLSSSESLRLLHRTVGLPPQGVPIFLNEQCGDFIGFIHYCFIGLYFSNLRSQYVSLLGGTLKWTHLLTPLKIKGKKGFHWPTQSQFLIFDTVT